MDRELAELNSKSGKRPVLNSAMALRTAVTADENDRTTVFLPSSGLDSFAAEVLPLSDVKFVARPGSGNNLILDEISRPPHVDANTSRKAIATLARKLAKSDPATFSLLTCKGVVVHEREKRGEVSGYTLVHRVPAGYVGPRSLRQCLLDQENTSHSLSDRLQLAKDLMKAVSYVHTFGFVHKNIRPETIIVFRSSSSSIGSVTLVGFEEFRSEDGKTYRAGDEKADKNVYRHPRRQGHTPQEDYIMQHDIYSLGVCLLEVGMWDSLLQYDNEDTGRHASASIAKYMPPDTLSKEGLLAAKDSMAAVARTKLPPRVGNKYAQVVETCLTCLDDGNDDFGDESEFLDEDGVLVGVRFIQKVRECIRALHPTHVFC